MNIQTERCLIREFVEADIDSFMEYHNDMEWMEYQDFKGLTKEEYRKELVERKDITGGMQFAIESRESGELLGDIYLWQNEREYWLGYSISPRFARQGYAFEAASAVIAWVKEQNGEVVKAGVEPENTASIELLKKLGFAFLEEKPDELVYILRLK